MSSMVSARQAAGLLGISPREVYEHIKSGRLRAVQVKKGGNFRIPMEEIERFRSSKTLGDRLFGWLRKK